MLRRSILSLVCGLVALAGLAAWSPASAGVDIRVDLASQTLTATAPDGTVRKWAISSGRTGYRTPRGVYRPQVMKPYHWSRKYGGHMPHSIFFKGGFAIHGTTDVARLGRPASHGCIRLHPGAARELYGMVKRHGAGGTRIAINGVAPDTGKTMIAKRKNTGSAVAERQRSRDRQLIAPAFAPQPIGPDPRLWQRLR